MVSSVCYQGSDLVVSGKGPSEGVHRSLRSGMAGKWLNVVLDLNGILCVTEDWKSKWLGQVYNKKSEPHSATVAAIVGPKAVYVRPDCSTFLKELGKIAFVSVWSSMKKSTVDEICAYLFRGEGSPFQVLGQDACKMLKRWDGAGTWIPYKEPGTDKPLLLKNLDVLFGNSQSNFTPENTVIVDDSRRKHIMNKPENVIISETWSNRGKGDKDTFLLGVLLPWFQELHRNHETGLKSFRKAKKWKIGLKMLCEERNRREYEELMKVVRESPSGTR